MRDRSTDFQAVVKSMALLGIDVSWLPDIILILQWQHPEILDQAIDQAIREHLEYRHADPERHVYTGDGTSSCVFCHSPMNAHLEGTGL